MLFEGRFSTAGFGQAFDVSPDGTRFLMLKPSGALSDDTTSNQNVVAVLNCFEELKDRVPVP